MSQKSWDDENSELESNAKPSLSVESETEAELEDLLDSSQDEAADGLLLEPQISEDFLNEQKEDQEREALIRKQLEQAEALESEQLQAEELEGTELEDFDSADIEELEFLEEVRLDSIVESVLFASDRPVSLNHLKLIFKGTNIRTEQIKRSLDRLAVELAGAVRGVTLEEVPGGYQLRTKVDNMVYLSRAVKARPFKLSGPALEVLSIVAYKQPVVKSEIDEIRGVESGHLLRALMEKALVQFEGRSDLPGKPMQYGTTKKFLEIFGLRNLKELPTLSMIDELIPEGMTEEEAKPTLSSLTDSLSQQIGSSYSEGEDELLKIEGTLTEISTTTEFFEQEKLRMKQKRDAEKAESIREAMIVGEEVSNRDRNWLARYDEALAGGTTAQFAEQQGDSAAAQAESEELASVSEGLFEQEPDHEMDRELNVEEYADIEEEPGADAGL